MNIASGGKMISGKTGINSVVPISLKNYGRKKKKSKKIVSKKSRKIKKRR